MVGARLPGEGWMVRESYQWSANSSQLYKASICFSGRWKEEVFCNSVFWGRKKKCWYMVRGSLSKNVFFVLFWGLGKKRLVVRS